MEYQLITGNTWFGSMSNRPDKVINWRIFSKEFLQRFRQRFSFPEAGYDEKAKPILAFVNHGAWLVLCPQCGGGEYAWEEGWFFCCSCKNSYLGHRYRRLVFPKKRKRIEELLLIRPLDNRNWKSPETVADLERENTEHAEALLVPAEGGN